MSRKSKKIEQNQMATASVNLADVMVVPRTDPIYNCHAYLTKVPVGAIQPFIEEFSRPGETVVDFFAGSGMTGIAAQMCERRARLSDISVLGQHIARGYLSHVDPDEFRAIANGLVDSVRKELGDLYRTIRESDGKDVEMIRTVWSFTYLCPSCEYELVYFEHLDKAGRPPKACPSCRAAFAKRNWERASDVPVEVVVNGTEGKQVTQDVQEVDFSRIEKAIGDPRLAKVPSRTIDSSREMYSRSGLGKAGMTETSKFFSPRNAIALNLLWDRIDNIDDSDIRQKMAFAFTAILPRASKRYQWSAQRPLNAQNQTYYIAAVYYEWNVFELFMRKVEAALRADEVIASGRGARSAESKKADCVDYTLASADGLVHLADESVDYIFTDPPFGSNIFYSDMSLFHEAWLGKETDNSREAVVHTTGKKKNGAEDRYHKLLRGAFAEGFRVLKPGRKMSVVFGNSSGRIWGLVQRALRDSGFNSTPVHVAILDKGQRSVKGLNSGSEGVVTVDLILTVEKPLKSQSSDIARPLKSGDTRHLIEAAVSELSVSEISNPSHLYGRILTKAIKEHLLLDDLHLGDVLIALRQAGYTIDAKKGVLRKDCQSHAA